MTRKTVVNHRIVLLFIGTNVVFGVKNSLLVFDVFFHDKVEVFDYGEFKECVTE